MTDVVDVSAETGRKLQQLLKQRAPGARQKIPRVKVDKPQQRTAFYNDSGEEIPAYGVMKITGKESVGTPGTASHRWFYRVDKPDNAFVRNFLVNGSRAVPTGKHGYAQTGPHVRALFDDADGTPTAGDGYGPKPGQWSLAKNYPETALVAGPHGDGATLLAEWHDVESVLATADADIATGATGAGTILKGASGSEADAGFDPVTGRNKFTAITSGDTIFGKFINGILYWMKPGEGGEGDFCHLNGRTLGEMPEADIPTDTIEYIVGISDEDCFLKIPSDYCTINGKRLADAPVELAEDVQYLLGLKDGCIVLIEHEECNT